MISIILPTYNNEEFLINCLESLHRSFKEYHIYLGIDGCNNTLKLIQKTDLKHMNISVFHSPENVGPYVIKNSLIRYTKSEDIVFFDTDDAVYESFGDSIEKAFTKSRYIRFWFDQVVLTNGKIKHKYTSNKVAEGVFAIKKDLIAKHIGFFPWRCGADTEFYCRLKYKNEKCLNIKKPMFLRRIHSKNLTMSESTNFKSEARQRYISIIERKIESNQWVNPMLVTTELNLIYENTVT